MPTHLEKCNHAPTNGVGVPTHLKNEIRTASRLRTPGAAIHQFNGYPEGSNILPYLNSRYQEFMNQSRNDLFNIIESLLFYKCIDMPNSGNLEDGGYSKNFKSQANVDVREDTYPGAAQSPVTEHPGDEPQGSWEATRSLGQFFLLSEKVTYSGWVKREGCKCAIEWSGDLAIYDTPGVTTGPNDDSEWSAALIGLLGGRVNAGRQEIGRQPVGGWICCGEQ